jgi:mono/diheme cytochrome c family protein
VVGYFDWQIFYAGSYIFPIIMKLMLAGLLILLLAILVFISFKNEGNFTLRFAIHFFALLTVVGLGYFGGELVYGKKSTSAPIVEISDSALAGMKLFDKKCSFCHFTDRSETKVGPSLKGLFQMKKLPNSGKPVTSENIEYQLKTPLKKMPSFKSLDEDEIKSLTDYLQTL